MRAHTTTIPSKLNHRKHTKNDAKTKREKSFSDDEEEKNYNK